MPPAKVLRAAIGAGALRSVRKAARDANESVDRFVRRVLWHYTQGWFESRSIVIEECVRAAKAAEGSYRAQAYAMSSEYDDPSGLHGKADGAKETAEFIQRTVPARRCGGLRGR